MGLNFHIASFQVSESMPSWTSCSIFVHSFLQDSSSDSSYSSGDRYDVEYPPDGGVKAWLIVLACGILHLCSELVYFMFFNTIQIARIRNLRLAEPKDTYTEFMVFEDVRFAGGRRCHLEYCMDSI